MAKPLWHCLVPGKPIPQGRPRVRSKPFPTVYYSKRSQEYRTKLVEAFQDAGPIYRVNPCRVAIKVAGARADADLDNIAKQVLDALVEAEILYSDDRRTVAALEIEHDDKPGEYAEVSIFSRETA